MLDIKWIRENPDALDKALKTRGAEPAAARLIELDEARRKHIAETQESQRSRNEASKQIAKAKASGDEAAAKDLIDKVSTLKTLLQQAEEGERRLEKALREALAVIPNIPSEDTPVGADENANVELRRWGELPRHGDVGRPSNRPDLSSGFVPKEHFEIGEALGEMDFETAAKLSGSRFVVLKGRLARLERALGQFMLDLQTNEHGYTEVQPPLLVRDEALFGTSQLPKFAEDQFVALGESERHDFDAMATAWNRLRDEGRSPEDHANRDRLDEIYREELDQVPFDRRWLIPTAEVPLTNLVRESIVSESELPLRFAALTPCFRSEAGAAGKDTRGMMRQHQFNKVELVAITTPQQAEDEHERMLACAEEVLKRFDLHYRVMTLSTGDMGFAAEKTWDIEAWLPGQGRYREISSVSRCGDFQARRMEARYRDGDGKVRPVNTLNGSGVAVGRALIAVLETYQNEDGSVTVPSALAPYMAGIERIERED
jgi:seryl-tRNA synthetase